jgi:FkbM family methyltransferase
MTDRHSSLTTRPQTFGKAAARRIVERLFGLFPGIWAGLAFHVLVRPSLAARLLPARRDRLRQIFAADDAESDLAVGGERSESYAQEGEDLLLARFLGDKADGFYVDIGAHHPTRHSNTYLFYRRGWRGINVDATPGSMALFRKVRPRDINIECLVTSDSSTRVFYLLNEPALNTASPDLARLRPAEDGRFRVTETVSLHSRTLTAILDEHLPKGQAIDVLSVDVEGLDLDVLRSNDWQRYRPGLILVELLVTELDALDGHEIVRFLHGQGFKPIAKLYNTVFFRER